MLARPGQSLETHMENVTELASKFGSKIGLEELARVVALCHDIGKNTIEFQEYINGKIFKHEGGHSRYGAKYIYDNLKPNRGAAELLSNIILGHHGTLYDHIGHDGNDELLKKLENVPNIELDNLKVDFTIDKKKISEEIQVFLGLFEPEEKSFMCSFLIKYLFSCLVDADRLDAYRVASNIQYQEKSVNWSDCLRKLEEYLKTKESNTEMGVIRKKISDECAEAGQKGTGIYKLEVATGGGKTLSSLRFAIEHAKQHKMDRIIYIIPYLSIIDQTEKELKDLLGEEIVLAHHSSVLVSDENEEEEKYKLQADRWDSPIIVTTMVQFLESAFSSRASDLRKLHNMANSILVFDEIQSLPIKCIHLFNGLANFLKTACGSTLLLCSATQPQLDDINVVKRPICLSQKVSISVSEIPKRTEIINEITPKGYTAEELASFVDEKFDGESMLIIMNTKKAARECYDMIKSKFSENVNLVHLSTSMCSAHRKDKLDFIKECLGYKHENKRPIICVSTQLIEAGIDLSFKCVIRSLAGLDSIYQAAGRCNRHGEYGKVMPVYVLNIAGENLSKLPDILIGAKATQRVFDDEGDIFDYYKYYLYEQRDKMDYTTKLDNNITIYDLLSNNARGLRSYKNLGNTKPISLPHAMRTAGDEFFVIDKGQQNVVISYGESEKLLEQYEATFDIKEKVKILKQLGNYSIGLYTYQIEALSNVISGHEIGILKLEKSHYHEDFGLNVDGKLSFLMLGG